MAEVSGKLRDDATVLFDTVDMLLREKLYHSAEIVGGFLLSRASMPSPQQVWQQQLQEGGGGGLHAEALSMFADALKGRGKHKRATVRSRDGVLALRAMMSTLGSCGRHRTVFYFCY